MSGENVNHEQVRAQDFQDGAWDGIEQSATDIVQQARAIVSTVTTMREGGLMPDGSLPTAETLVLLGHTLEGSSKELIVLAERYKAVANFAEGG